MTLNRSLTPAAAVGVLALSLFHPSAASADRIATMDADELRPGMKAYGLTVFQGTEPERFDVTIMGVLKDRFAGDDMIIVQLDHPIMENIGGIAGMSGSPIFVDDKLVGAFAYGWGFSVRPIGGVTPIKNMMKVLDSVTVESQVTEDEIPASVTAWPEAASAFSEIFPKSPERQFAQAELAMIGVPGMNDSQGTVSMQPLGTPLLASTRSPRVMEELNKLFAGSTMVPVMMGAQGGSVGSRTDDPAYASVQPVDGGAMTVVICEGDLNLAGLGTITYVEGDRLIAFGHPMFGDGAVDAPVAVSEVVTVIPSVARPFKVGNAVREVGALRQDRLPAVGATLSSTARLVPMKLSLKAPETETDREFNFRIWDNRQILPQIAAVCMLESLESVRTTGPMMLEVAYTLNFADGRKIERTEYLSGANGVPFGAVMGMVSDLSIMLNNRFEALQLDSIDVALEVGQRQSMMVLDKVTQPKGKVRPGESIRGEISFDRWRQEKMIVPYEVQIPSDIRPGTYQVTIGNGAARAALEVQLRPELRRVENIDDLFNLAEPNFPLDTLYIALIDPNENTTLNNQRLGPLPTSITETTRATLRDAQVLGSTRARLISEQTIKYPAMVGGSRSFIITVEPEPYN